MVTGDLFLSRNRGISSPMHTLFDIFHKYHMFRSRNRVAFSFRQTMEVVGDDKLELFRSRNRGSFDFKSAPTVRLPKTPKRFNLVIEILLISRATLTLSTTDTDIRFQSRNRGSFDFKSPASEVLPSVL